MAEPKIVSVILHHKRLDETLACLNSLQENRYPNHSTVVLDTQAIPDSARLIREAYPQVEVEELHENRGYAGNNNVGITSALAKGADWVFVLNDDTVLAPDCLAQLVSVGATDPHIAIVGPMVYHFSEPDIIQSGGGSIGSTWTSEHICANERDSGQLSEPHDVDWITGCGIMIRRQTIEQIGMFDERYFMYWEETELCLRAGIAGWRVVHVPAAKMWHKGVSRDFQPSPSVTYYLTRNRLLTISKLDASPNVWGKTWMRMLRTLASWSIRPKWRHMSAHRDAMWHGMLDFLRGHYGPMPT